MNDQPKAIAELIEKIKAGRDYRTIRAICSDIFHDGIICDKIVASYLGGLESAFALHEALLPNWHFNISTEANSGFYAHVSDLKGNSFLAGSTAPARTWLIAILKAYAAEIGGAA